MPIPVECPDCDAELTIPDALAGKLVKCPHCSGAVRVPRDEPAPRERRTRPAARPPKRRAKPKNTAGIVVGVSVALAVIVAAAVGATMLARAGKKDAAPEAAQKPPDTQGAPAVVLPGNPSPLVNPVMPVPVGPPRPPLPDGWIDFRHPKGEYSVHVPRKAVPMPKKRDRDMSAIAGFNESGYYTPNTTIQRPELVCTMVSVNYPPEVMDSFRTGNLDLSVVERMFPGMKMNTTRITWLGRTAIDVSYETDLGAMMGGVAGMAGVGNKMPPGELKLPNGLPTKNVMYMRYVAVGDRVYAFVIQNMYGPPTEAEKRAFFDSVALGR
jgi:hypothetical protein